jgi:ABC-type amino acid transport substrate-binding protein/serine phosphatase RsbU (regulator of sigma subunit)
MKVVRLCPRIFVFSFLLVWMFSSLSMAAEIELTLEEKTWLAANPVIRVANETDWPPFDYVRDNKPYGFSIDMIKMAADQVSLQVEFVNGFTWSELIKKFHEGKLDLLPAVYFTPKRSQTMVFTDGYAVNPPALVLHKDRTELLSLKDLKGHKIALLPDTSFDHLIKERHPDITRIPIDGAKMGMEAVAFGKVDGFIESLSVVAVLLETNMLSNLKVVSAEGLHKEGENNLRMAAKKKDKLLRDILQKSLRAIQHGTKSKLFEKHFAANRRLFEIRSDEASKINFTEKERQWLSDHPVMTYSEVDWQPMSIIEKNKMVGVMGDYLDIISKATGIRFEFVEANSWPDVLKKFDEKEIDIIPGIGNSNREKKLGLISKPYSKYPLSIIGKDSMSFVNGPEDLSGMTLAIPKYFTSSNYIKENFPELHVRDTTSIKEALSLVSAGKADVFIGHKLVSIYNMEAQYFDNLKIIGLTDFEFVHSILVQRSDPELLSIINKVIDQISLKTKKRIYNDWVKISIEQAVDYVLLIKIGAGVLAFLLLIVYWNRKLGREIKERKVAEALLADKEAILRIAMDNMPGGIAYTDEDLNIVVSNQRFGEMLNLPAEFLAPGMAYPEAIRHAAENGYFGPGDPEEMTRQRVETLRNPSSEPLELRLPTGEAFNVLRQRVEQGGVVTIATDITERVKAEEQLTDALDIISSSINYASQIQRSVLPAKSLISSLLSDYMVLWEPRDVVGGDIYWCRPWGDGVLIVLGDCTGHGVPGAFMTLIATGALDNALTEVPIGKVGKLLQRIHQLVQTTLGQHEEGSKSDDGMELGLCYVGPERDEMTFSGARFDLFIIEGNEINIIKSTKSGIGYRGISHTQEFIENKVDSLGQKTFYMSSDGLTDQIGGKKNLMFGKKRFKALLLRIQDKSMNEQKDIMLQALIDYQGEQKRRDDVSVIGFKV